MRRRKGTPHLIAIRIHVAHVARVAGREIKLGDSAATVKERITYRSAAAVERDQLVIATRINIHRSRDWTRDRDGVCGRVHRRAQAYGGNRGTPSARLDFNNVIGLD